MTNTNSKKITITFTNGMTTVVDGPTPIKKILEQTGQDSKTPPVLAVKINGRLAELGFPVSEDCTIEIINIFHQDALPIYERGLAFILIMAVEKLFPKRRFKIIHSISRGLYGEFNKGIPVLFDEDVEKIKEEM